MNLSLSKICEQVEEIKPCFSNLDKKKEIFITILYSYIYTKIL